MLLTLQLVSRRLTRKRLRACMLEAHVLGMHLMSVQLSGMQSVLARFCAPCKVEGGVQIAIPPAVVQREAFSLSMQ